MTATDPSVPARHTPPQRILLATDLSCRCDRAQDRAVRLAELWSAKLCVLHTLEGADPPDLPSWRRSRAADLQAAERQIRRDIAGRDIDVEVIVGRGEPADVVLREAAVRGCDLIVTGLARAPMFGLDLLGNTVERVVRRARVPVLVVKTRPHRDYTDLVVATDFSETSRDALEYAATLSPDCRTTLLHAYRVPFEGILKVEEHQEEYRLGATEECAAFLAKASLAASCRGRLRTLLEYGAPDEIVGAYAWDNDVDLAVFGTHGRSGPLQALLGGTAERLLATLPCDVLLVPPLRASKAIPSAALSGIM